MHMPCRHANMHLHMNVPYVRAHVDMENMTCMRRSARMTPRVVLWIDLWIGEAEGASGWQLQSDWYRTFATLSSVPCICELIIALVAEDGAVLWASHRSAKPYQAHPRKYEKSAGSQLVAQG